MRSKRFSDYLLDRLIPKKENSLTNPNKSGPPPEPSFKEAVVNALQEIEEDKKWEEIRKTYPKEELYDLKETYICGGKAFVGDWLAINGIVYEILEIKSWSKRHRDPKDPAITGVVPYYQYDEYGIKVKVKGVSINTTVRGWLTFTNNGPIGTLISRNAEEPKLDQS